MILGVTQSFNAPEIEMSSKRNNEESRTRQADRKGSYEVLISMNSACLQHSKKVYVFV